MPKKKKQSKKQNKPVVLAILDGFGLANPKNDGNAITPKTAPHIFSYMKKLCKGGEWTENNIARPLMMKLILLNSSKPFYDTNS